jgi:ribosomal protein S17
MIFLDKIAGRAEHNEKKVHVHMDGDNAAGRGHRMLISEPRDNEICTGDRF